MGLGSDLAYCLYKFRSMTTTFSAHDDQPAIIRVLILKTFIVYGHISADKSLRVAR